MEFITLIFLAQKLFRFPETAPFYATFLAEVERFKQQCEGAGISGEDLICLTEEPLVFAFNTFQISHFTWI